MKPLHNRIRKSALILIASVILLGGMYLIPLPYYLKEPGDLEALAPRITVENGHKNEQGSFYLTTVLSSKLNVYNWIASFFRDDVQIEKAKDVKGGLTDEEYSFLLRHMMSTSQQNAIIAGLKEAGVTVPAHHKGVFVTSIIPESNLANKLDVGDVITAVDGQPTRKASDMIDYIRHKKAGEAVSLSYRHRDNDHTESVKLIQLPSGKPGLGIMPEDEYAINPPRNVTIEASDIGGPSAGLMFSLEVYSQTLPNYDLTRGYQIAGTGALDIQGNVQQIGGIRDKIVAAHAAGIDIFFAPADVKPGDSNTKDILDEAKKRGYKITIVPVKSTHEAVAYLRKLTPKS
ncbi:PDZ domain-containing protein [Paenibacillus zeisoli]|uniref:endopeptidase La n=1 Tax=Paenibacillus zeisoli TaxID=2496267 RepID=A0A3S1BW34_9BACL|nr:SepM family pheromone-processing serine protease [Paenibacillus zeisoli]RUT35633.1 PDZ domain-containing protein [Paenibacillus zeisoli]